jgi:hypothetical protein
MEKGLNWAADCRGFTLIEQKQLQELTTEGTESTGKASSFDLARPGCSRLHSGVGSLATRNVAREPQGVLKAKHA